MLSLPGGPWCQNVALGLGVERAVAAPDGALAITHGCTADNSALTGTGCLRITALWSLSQMLRRGTCRIQQTGADWLWCLPQPAGCREPHPDGLVQPQDPQCCCPGALRKMQAQLWCQLAACCAAEPGGLPALVLSTQERTRGGPPVECFCITSSVRSNSSLVSRVNVTGIALSMRFHAHNVPHLATAVQTDADSVSMVVRSKVQVQRRAWTSGRLSFGISKLGKTSCSAAGSIILKQGTLRAGCATPPDRH